MKDYRDGLTENKFVQRKKDIVAQKEAIQKGNEEGKRGREEYPVREHQKESLKYSREGKKRDSMHQGHNFSSNKSVPRARAPRSALKQQKSTKMLAKEEIKSVKVVDEGKSANLFDNIHYLLLNPQKNRASN